MEVKLAPVLEEFIQRKVGQGAYASADEVIAAGLALMCSDDDEEWKAQARDKISEGLESAHAGRLHSPESVTAWMAARKQSWAEAGRSK